MRTRYLIILILTLLIGGYGCGSDGNRLEIANNYLISQVDSASNHLLVFRDFKKVDGIEKQKETTIYELTFTGRIEATTDCYWDGNITSNGAISEMAESWYGSNFGIKRLGLREMNVSTSLDELNQKNESSRHYNLYKKDFGQYVKGYIIFEKRDSGWKIIEMDIKYDQEANEAYTTKSNNSPTTQKIDSISQINDYVGEYTYSTTNGGYGNVLVYAQQNRKLLFYLSLYGGGASNSSGDLYGSFDVVDNKGTFFKKEDYDERGCKLSFNFNNNKVTIEAVAPFNECEFGNGVTGDGIYNKKSSVLPTHFEDNGGTVVYFDKTTPEYYYKHLR